MCVYNVFSLQVYEVDCSVADPGGGGEVVNTNGGELQLIQS